MRNSFLPYALPYIGEEEIAEVADSLRSGWVTTGPKVKRFEQEFAAYVGAKHAVAVNSCTAALHTSLAALDVGYGDEVIVPTLTFCATANVIVHLGATPVIVDVDPDFQMSPEAVRRAISPRTKAVIPVHYGGQACGLREILDLADRHGLPVVEDAAHAAGAESEGARIGSHGHAVCFSFYATKNLTTGEGGMITTNNDRLARRLRSLSLHGMSRDAWKRYTEAGSWYYEVLEAGYKYNMTDVQAALGIHQLRRLDGFIARRQQIAAGYDQALSELPEILLPRRLPGRNHTFHLYPIRLEAGRLRLNRSQFIDELRARNIGASVHFIPLHRHPFYRERYGYRPEQFPVCEQIYRGLLSLPLYPKMTDQDVKDVIAAVRNIVASHRIPAGRFSEKGVLRATIPAEL
ncbi:MAG: DegT/DnrJ/EryC1/StrS aminotransferase family protein [Acidobacteria bacterium]|nr:DegT/DnrJ/EryC1/StrS aminotransferase family protein [Acidobacteriota bacterium]